MDDMKRYIAMVALTTALTGLAAPIDDAKKLYRDGDYAAAVEKLRPIVKRSPRDGTANYYLGAALMKLGDNEAARGPLKVAESRGVADASELLAADAIADYRIDDAQEHLDTWEEAFAKKRKALPREHALLSSRLINIRNMLDRVEQIEILDSLSVDAADFFTHYRLSEYAGRILPSDAVRRLGAIAAGADVSTAFLPQSNTELLWSQTDSAGVYELYSAGILDDGTIDNPMPLGQALGEGGDAKYPFLLPDGVTLYFANNGENSLGGYDIFMTRRSDDGTYYQPQNMGMPYNSAANDYMLAIDEASGLGWWATDRNADEGMLTIYVFAPSAMRVNVDPSDEQLRSLALLDNIAITRKPDVDYKAMLESRLPAAADDGDISGGARFSIDLGHGKVYTSLSDFRHDNAKAAMIEVLTTEAELRRRLATEDDLRERYRRGDHSCADDILASEAQTAKLRRQLKALRNKVVRLEYPNGK